MDVMGKVNLNILCLCGGSRGETLTWICFVFFVFLFTNFDKKVNIFVFPKSNTGIVIEVVLRIRIRMQSLQHQNNV